VVKSHTTFFEKIICLENLFFAWDEFKRGKARKNDVARFAFDVEDNLFDLYEQLSNGRYTHSSYTSFYLCDPKLRHIHKPAIKDRIVHHAIVAATEPFFERHFIFNSYSSRKGKGTHRAVKRLHRLAWRLSFNNTKTVWILHCDVRKFFDSVDHGILLRLIRRRIGDPQVLELIEKIVHSYHTQQGKGIPLGNLTSQLFSNIYLNELDQFITNTLGLQNYIRYADDVVIIARNKIFLESIVSIIGDFLANRLQLTLHPKKMTLRKWHQGIDFLGYVSFPHYTILRTKTKRRMFKRISEKNFTSYNGILQHCRSRKLQDKLFEIVKKDSK
jgi:retron-type reverse transcriptase